MMVQRSSSARRRNAGSSLGARLEMLETRTLLSAITGYQIGDAVQPTTIAVDGNGDVWMADGIGQIEKVHKAADGTVSDIVFAAPNPTSIAYDPVNQDMYVSNIGFGLEKFDLNGNLLATYTPANDVDEPDALAVATDGSVWFTTMGSAGSDPNLTYTADIGRLDLSGNFAFKQIPIDNTIPNSISAASDGSVWIGTAGDDNPNSFGLSYLAQASSNTNGTLNLTMYTVPQNAGLISSVAVAPDNSVWYAIVPDGSSVSQRPAVSETIDHATLANGTLSVTAYPMAESAADAANGGVDPGEFAFDSTGQLWFDDANAIDTIDTTTGDITRTSPGAGAGFPDNVAVSSTDVWVLYPGGANFNLADIDLATFSAPVAATSPDITASSGQAFSGPVAVFASSDVGNFNYTISFGNGTTQTGTLASNSSGIYTIDGSTTYAAPGTYATNVTIVSDAGDTASVNGQATVTSGAAPLASQGVNLTAQRGQAIAPNVSGVANVVVAQFSGPAGTYSATINWGDSTSTVGQIVSAGSNQYYVEIPTGSSKSYATEGTYNISVVITNGTASTTATSTATISAVPVVASQNLVLQPLLGGIVLNAVANFTADTSSTASWFRATINWGDGTTSVGLVVRTSAGHYTIIGLHIYAKKGTYTVDTTILDGVDAENALATASIKIK
jgi:sugar lactone lactonase YvrE